MPSQMRTSTPPRAVVAIVRLGGYLIASLHTGLDDGQLSRFRRDLIDEVGRRETRGVLIDLAAVDVLDSFACLTLRQIARVVGLRGAVTVVVGLTPDVGFAMVQLGADLGTARTAAELDEGLHLLHAQFLDVGA